MGKILVILPQSVCIILYISTDITGIGEPKVPRKRKRPERLNPFNASSSSAAELTANQHYSMIYCEVFDLIISSIKTRFDNTGYKLFSGAERVLLNGVQGREYDITSLSRYSNEIDLALLRDQLLILKKHFEKSSDVPVSLQSILTALGDCPSLYSECVKLSKLLLLLPATNAASERMFSQLRRLKSYLRSTMGQARLNHLMMLTVHRDSELDYSSIVNDFIDNNSQYRSKRFKKL